MRSGAALPTQIRFLDLPDGVLRQVVEDRDISWPFVFREVLRDVIANRLHSDRRAGVGGDVQHRHLAVGGVGASDHGGLGDLRKLVDDDLDLPGIDVLAAADDHVLGPVDQDQVAIFVEVTDVAGVQPAVDEGLRGLLRPVQVATHHVVALDDNLAGLTVGDRAACLVDDPDGLPGQRQAHSPRFAGTVQRVDRTRACSLRKPVALDDRDAEARFESFQ